MNSAMTREELAALEARGAGLRERLRIEEGMPSRLTGIRPEWAEAAHLGLLLLGHLDAQDQARRQPVTAPEGDNS